MSDTVERRIVVEFGRQYAYVYWCDGNGKVLDDESFRQPYRMDRQEVHEEARELFDLAYQHLLDTVAASSAEDSAESDEEDTP